MEVKRNDKRSVTPDNNGTFLARRLSKSKYDLCAAVHRPTERVVFLYFSKESKGQTFVTCPYSHKDTKAGSKIPCAKVNITNALKKEKEREKAAMQELKKINTYDFEWEMHGNDNDFSISVPEKKNILGRYRGNS